MMHKGISVREHFICGLDPVKWARRHLYFEADPWQADALKSKRDMVLCCGRQMGKSTTTALIAAHRVLFFPRQTVVVVSPAQRQSSELFKKAQDFIRAHKIRGKFLEDNRLSLTLPNKSRLISLPANEAGIRGFSVDLLICDEASRIQDITWHAIRPTVAATKGRTILLSTPRGQLGFFAEAALEYDDNWHRIFAPASICPRFDPVFLQREKEILGPSVFSQEYENNFLADGELVFDLQAFEDNVGPRVPPMPYVPKGQPLNAEETHETPVFGRI